MWRFAQRLKDVFFKSSLQWPRDPIGLDSCSLLDLYYFISEGYFLVFIFIFFLDKSFHHTSCAYGLCPFLQDSFEKKKNSIVICLTTIRINLSLLIKESFLQTHISRWISTTMLHRCCRPIRI